MNSINKRVLVLNLDYRPLNICNVRRAFVLLLNGKAEVIEQYADDLVTAEARYTRPSVIKLQYLVKRPPTGPRLVRQEVFRRDGHTCQYCGVHSRELTIDHVLPRHRGGGHTWGKPGLGLQGLQPPQRRPHGRGSAYAPAGPARQTPPERLPGPSALCAFPTPRELGAVSLSRRQAHLRHGAISAETFADIGPVFSLISRPWIRFPVAVVLLMRA